LTQIDSNTITKPNQTTTKSNIKSNQITTNN